MRAQSPSVRRNQLSFFCGGARGLGASVAPGKFLDAAGGIDKFLFAGEKRMASSANTDLDVPACRTGMVDRAASADHVRLRILRMDARFHVEKESPQ